MWRDEGAPPPPVWGPHPAAREENLAGGTSLGGSMQTRQGKEPSIKCQEEPRATRPVQSLLWEELFYLTGCSLG